MTIITITFSISIVGINRWPPSQVTASGRRAAVTHCGRRTWNRAAAQIRSTLPLPSADDDTSPSHVCSEHTWSSCRCHLHDCGRRNDCYLLLCYLVIWDALYWGVFKLWRNVHSFNVTVLLELFSNRIFYSIRVKSLSLWWKCFAVITMYSWLGLIMILLSK